MHSPSTIVDISIFHLDIPRRRMTPLLPCYISHGSRTPSPSPDICPPSGIGRRASIISELDKACTDSPVSPSFPRIARSSSQTHPTTPALSSPVFLHSPTESAPAPALPPAREPPIPLSFVLAHVSHFWLPVLARVSKCFSAAMQLAPYRTLDLSADDADTCVARLAGARPSRCARLPARA
ncbi:hypothetical protein EDB83DRAFT_2520711 [Lactarius deliciosus]|nr:hypothetical protein EDB83DRAFT_2520711 [Lactarius deliciosus]